MIVLGRLGFLGRSARAVPNRTYKRITANTANHTTETAIAPATGDTLQGIDIPGADGTKTYMISGTITESGLSLNDVTLNIRIGTNGTTADALFATYKRRFSSGHEQIIFSGLVIPPSTAVTGSKVTISTSSSNTINDLGASGLDTHVEITEVFV